jgi:hypothetical protein
MRAPSFKFLIAASIALAVVAPTFAQTDDKVPGARREVAGHVPDQLQQAQTVPVTASTSPIASRWWSPGQGTPLAKLEPYADEHGILGILNAAGPIETKGHPFFEPIGTNGRACVSCHQPESGMGLSAASVRERWNATNGKDPIFAAIDGMNCPHLPPGSPDSHSLLLERGLFRIFLPWPPKAADCSSIDPEFTIEVVLDPEGCNLNPK